MLQLEGFLDGRLVSLVKSLGRKTNEDTTILLITPSEEGLKLSTEHNKTIQAHLYLPHSCFRQWQWKKLEAEETQMDKFDSSFFAIPFSRFVLALGILCNESSSKIGKSGKSLQQNFKMQWNNEMDNVSIKYLDFQMIFGIIMTIRTAEESSQVECSVTTVSANPIISLKFSDDSTNPILAKIITSGDKLKEWLCSFLDRDRFSIELDPTLPTIVLRSEDHLKTIEVAIPSDSESIEGFHCNSPVHQIYPSLFIANALKVLTLTSKASLRINSLGVMSLQMMIPMVTDSAYLEFIIAPFVNE